LRIGDGSLFPEPERIFLSDEGATMGTNKRTQQRQIRGVKICRSDKPLCFVLTEGVAAKMEQDLLIDLYAAVITHFKIKPMDLFVFQPNGVGKIKLSVNGYEFFKPEAKEERYEIGEIGGNLCQEVWCKIDEEGDFFVGTFLFPDEY
jgi:hypothetical protein